MSRGSDITSGNALGYNQTINSLHSSYITATLLNQDAAGHSTLRQKIDQAVAVFLYEEATRLGFPYRPDTPISTEEHNFDSIV
ncbi:hypothetical protein RvY_00226 [Ramazzottius varieornatus]|uniref:Uncharacterized protein n=1 Tax=Ramazzottius varieornatus TaxID=947166 RepID=A0A1D1UFP2_RAMVA|nr:hypothetical protein RvY_00226 [Ramazzottius varieornatus]